MIARNSLKPLFKRAIHIFLLIVIISLPFIVLNIFLSQKKSSIENILTSYTKGNVYIGRVYFSFPDKIVFRDVSFGALAVKKKDAPIFAKVIKLSFSLKDLFLRKKIYISNANIEGLRLDLSYYMVLSIDLKKIIRALTSIIEGRQINIRLKNSLFILPSYQGTSLAVNLDGDIYVGRKKNVYSKGKIAISHYYNRGYVPSFKPLYYKIKGFFVGERFNIGSLELAQENTYVKLWGDVNRYTVKLEGMVLNNPELASSLWPVSFFEKIKNAWHKKKLSSVSVINTSTSLNIYDLSMALEILPHKITAKHIDFSLNNIPFHLEGVVSLENVAAIDIILSSYPRQPFSSDNVSSKKTLLHIHGKYSRNKFKGAILLKFVKEKPHKKVIHNLDVKVNNLSFSPLGAQQFGAEFASADISYSVGDDIYNISLSNFHSIINLRDRYLKFVSFKSNVYGGVLKGRGWVDVSRLPFGSFFFANIKGAEAHNLRGVLEYLEKVYGKMDCIMQYKNYPRSKLWGQFTINDGYLDNIIFFNWLAKFFNLPTLRKVLFKNLRSSFYVDDEGSRLEDIILTSSEVNLKGYFRVSDNDLVSSKISLVFSEKLLNSSIKFKRLLKMLGKENAQKVNFNFQLSGLFNSMNFKWLESDFKDRLKKLMPSGMERAIENRIEKVIESISKEK